MVIAITNADAEEIKESITSLMNQWDPRRDRRPYFERKDYQCAFCQERPPNNNAAIHHAANCKGGKFLRILRKAQRVAERQAKITSAGY